MKKTSLVMYRDFMRNTKFWFEKCKNGKPFMIVRKSGFYTITYNNDYVIKKTVELIKKEG